LTDESRITSLLLLVAVLGFIAKYFLNVFLALHLTAETYGDFNVAIKFLLILVGLSLFGTNIGAQRFLALYLRTNLKPKAQSYLAWNIKIVAIMSVIALGFVATSHLIFYLVPAFKIKYIEDYHLAVYMLWIAPFATFGSFLSYHLLSTNQIFMSIMLLKVFSYMVQLLFFILILLLLGPMFNHAMIVLGVFISFLALASFALYFMNKDLLLMLWEGCKNIRTTKVIKTEWFYPSLRMISSNIIFLISGVIDLMIVEAVCPDEAQVGYYAAVLTISGLIWLLATDLYLGLKPNVSALLVSVEAKKKLQVMLNKTNSVVILACAIPTLIILCFASQLLSYFVQCIQALNMRYLSW